jgi:diguanylate cyclase (GGDEF)-like protein
MFSEKEYESLDDYVKLSEFADIGIGIAASKAIDEAMEQVLDKVGEIFSPDTWALVLLDVNLNKLFFKLTAGKNKTKLKDVRISRTQGFAGWIFDNNKPLFSSDVSQDPKHTPHLEKVLGFPIKTILGAPLVVNTDVIGLLYLINRTDDKTYTDQDINVITTIADFTSVTIEKVYYLSAIKDMGHIDPLTGVYHRRSFENQYHKEVERCKRYGHHLGLILVDINDLNEINVKHGHTAGDEVLKNFTNVMRKCTRRIDILGRHGGSQFAILLPHTKKHEGEVVRKRIYKAIEDQNKKSKKVAYTVSLGLHAEGPEKVADLMEYAEKDLEKQKKAPKKKK